MTERKPYLPYEAEAGHCGPASLLVALRSLGIEITQEQLDKEARFDPSWGTDYQGMIEAGSLHGQVEASVDKNKLPDLEKVAKTTPVIVNIMDGEDYSKDGHYCLLEGSSPEGVVIFDAKEGEITMKREEFNNRWFDIDRLGDKVEGWSLVIRKNGS